VIAFRLLLLVVGLSVPVLAAGALGGVNVAAPPRIVFASNATSAFGEHTDLIAVDTLKGTAEYAAWLG